jgi:ATP-dependent protease ClpP protease subunit
MDTAILKIYGDIGEDFSNSFIDDQSGTISSKMVSEFLDANKEADQITVRINSRGGDVQEGWAIHDLLVNSGKKVKTIGEGRVYSIATIIFLAGSEREIMKNADGLIHNPYIPQYTLADSYNSGDLLKIADGLLQEEEKILNFYIEKTGADPVKLAEYMKEDTKLSADDMMFLGFATKIIEPIKAFAYIKPKIKMMDEKDVKTFGEKLDAILDKFKAFSRLAVNDQMMTDKDGKEFKLDKEKGAPAIGDKATPDGIYTMASGEKITVNEGVVTEISEDTSEIEQAKAKITELEARVALFESEKAALAISKDEDDRKVAEAVAMVTELTALKNTWKPAARGQNIDAGKKVEGFDLEKAKAIAKKMDQIELTNKTE